MTTFEPKIEKYRTYSNIEILFPHFQDFKKVDFRQKLKVKYPSQTTIKWKVKTIGPPSVLLSESLRGINIQNLSSELA